jgi:hypothetical protein
VVSSILLWQVAKKEVKEPPKGERESGRRATRVSDGAPSAGAAAAAPASKKAKTSQEQKIEQQMEQVGAACPPGLT